MTHTSPPATPELEYKIIYDTIHGSIKVDGVMLELIETPELQKLRDVHQLGLAYLVFPGANHTRFEHSIGASHVASQMAHTLKLDEYETNLVKTAALLHDVGHGPFSHVLDFVLLNLFRVDHMILTQEIIKGEQDILLEEYRELVPERRKIPDILESYGLDPKDIVDIVAGNVTDYAGGTKKYLGQMIHGAVDADQIDFLLRDSHYTGVAYGSIDLARLLQTLAIKDQELVVHKRGVPAVESILVARALMFSSVYLHRVVRVTDLMLTRAIEHLDREVLLKSLYLTDSELMEQLKRAGGYPREIAVLLRHRKIFKTAYYKRSKDLSAEQRDVINRMGRDRQLLRSTEETICERAGVPKGHVIIDIPAEEIAISEPRITRTDVMILGDDNKTASLADYSPLSTALQVRAVTDWAVMVITDPQYVPKVSETVEDILFARS
jgi:hypothetical protein